MALTPGTRLGPYEVINSIGAGGMGEVYRARDTRLDRDVALKILPDSFALDPDRRARFEREAKAVAALSHPNILAIFDVGEADGKFYAATELLEGQTLRERLASGPLPPRKAIECGVQLARGLASAHDKGIVHRDLKPENIFMVNDGQIKILDFGLAKAVGAGPAHSSGATETMAVTDPGTVMGTVGYMAPEQVRGKGVDARADLFSLGAVLFEVVTGQRAFHRDTAADTMSAILREEPPELVGTRPDLSPALDRIIRHCLEKEPNDRFQTARDVAFALTSLSGSGTSATSSANVVTPERRRSRAWLTPALVAIAAAGGVLLGMWMTPPVPLITFEPKTAVAQAIFHGRFMPDGQTLIYSSALTGNTPALFESRADTAIPRQFGPPATHLLAISKSGELAVMTNARFVAHRLMFGTLARMTVDGAPRPIADDVREADWLPDGSDLVVVRVVNESDRLEFPMGHVVSTTAGYFSDPRVSPDGKLVAFMEHPVKFDNRGWVKVVDRNGNVTSIAGEFSAEEGVAWSADSRTVFFAAVRSDHTDYEIHNAPADGSAPFTTVLSSAGSLMVLDRAPDGRMAVARTDNTYAVAARANGGAELDLTILDQSWGPSLAPDGTFVTMTDGNSGDDYGVVLRRLDGSPAARLGDGNAGELSPDGRWVTANIFSTGRCLVYPTGAGRTVPIEMGPLQQCATAAWFPDGKSLMIVGNEPGKPARNYRASFPGGTPEALLPEDQQVRAISADGRHLLVFHPDATFTELEIGASSTPVKGLRARDLVLDWSSDRQSATVWERGTMPAVVARVNLATGERTKITELAPANQTGVLSVGPQVFRNNGRDYAYGYVRMVSTLYLVSGLK
jgi:serine/threonine protein kinase